MLGAFQAAVLAFPIMFALSFALAPSEGLARKTTTSVGPAVIAGVTEFINVRRSDDRQIIKTRFWEI